MLVEPIKGSWQWVPTQPSPEPQSQLPQSQPQQPSEPAAAHPPTIVSPVEPVQEIQAPQQQLQEQPQPAVPTLVIGTPPAPSPQQTLEQQLSPASSVPLLTVTIRSVQTGLNPWQSLTTAFLPTGLCAYGLLIMVFTVFFLSHVCLIHMNYGKVMPTLA